LDRTTSGPVFDHFYFHGGVDEISLTQAMGWWGIPQDVSGILLSSYLQDFYNQLHGMDQLMRATNGEIILKNGRSVTWDDIGKIRALDEALQKKFVAQLAILKRRWS